MNAPTLAKIMCQVQGNDHYDSDYAPCSECRELASAILAKEATQPLACGEPTVTPVTVIHYRAGCACGWSLTYTTLKKAELAARGHVAIARQRLEASNGT